MVSSGMIGAAIFALAVSSVHAFPRPEGLTEGDGTTTVTTTGNPNPTVHHSSGSVSCSSRAVAKSHEYWEDAYINLVTNAIASACTDPGWVGDIDKIEGVYDFAKAYAEAFAKGIAECESEATGDAKVEGCAYAAATAYAYEYAFVDVHAEASAKAFTDYCGCNEATAIDWAIGSISQELIADAFASVDVTACVEGTDQAEARASVNCWADIYAKAFASSLSKAIVYSSCSWWSTDRVRAQAEINVDSWVYESDECTFITFADGPTLINTSGSSSTTRLNRHRL